MPHVGTTCVVDDDMTSLGTCAAGLLGLSMVLFDRTAAATPAETGARYRAGFYARVGPPGLLMDGEFEWRIALAPKEGFLLDHAHLDLGGALSLSPVHAGVGPVLELEPAAFLVVRARLLAMSWLGTLSSRAASGYLAEVGGQLRLALSDTGPIVLAEVRYGVVSSSVREPGREPYHDLVLEPLDQVLTTNAILGWRFRGELVAGLRWERTASLTRVAPRHNFGVFLHAPLYRSERIAVVFETLFAAYILDEDYRPREGRGSVGASVTIEAGL